MDHLTRYMVEKGNGDLDVKDNTGKSPLDLTGAAPKYQIELRQWYNDFMDKKPKPVPEEPKDPTLVSNEFLKIDKTVVFRSNSSLSSQWKLLHLCGERTRQVTT